MTKLTANQPASYSILYRNRYDTKHRMLNRSKANTCVAINYYAKC